LVLVLVGRLLDVRLLEHGLLLIDCGVVHGVLLSMLVRLLVLGGLL
jgi:hypothetical protein